MKRQSVIATEGEIICMGFFDKVIANNWAFQWSNLNTRLSRVTYFIAHSFASARASASSSSHFPASCQYLWRGTQQLLSKCIYMKRNIMLGHSTYSFFLRWATIHQKIVYEYQLLIIFKTDCYFKEVSKYCDTVGDTNISHEVSFLFFYKK